MAHEPSAVIVELTQRSQIKTVILVFRGSLKKARQAGVRWISNGMNDPGMRKHQENQSDKDKIQQMLVNNPVIFSLHLVQT